MLWAGMKYVFHVQHVCTCKHVQDKKKKKCTTSTLEFMTCWWAGWFWDVECRKQGSSFNGHAADVDNFSNPSLLKTRRILWNNFYSGRVNARG